MARKASNMEELELMLAQMGAARARRFVEPRYPLKFLTERLGISGSTVRNWMTRDIVPLDADESREGRGWRQFSERDAIALSAAQDLSRLGVPTTAFQDAIGAVLKSADDWMSRPHVYMSANRLIRRELLLLFPVADGWASALLAGKPDSPLPEDLPEFFVVLDLTALLKRTLEALGLIWFAGTAEEIRKMLAERGHKLDKDK